MNENKYSKKFILLSSLFQKGLLNIMGASVINKIIALLSNIFIVRILSKVEYGRYGWAYNIVSFFLLFNGLGIQYGILQFCSENIGVLLKKEYYKFGFLYGIAVGILLSVGLLVYSLFGTVSLPEGRKILIILSFIPIFDFLYNYILIVLRSNLQNKEYSIVTNINSIFHFIFMLGGAFFIGIKGYIIGLYLSYIIVFMYVLLINKNKIYNILITPIQKISYYTHILKYSLICACNVAISQLLYILDVF